MARDGLSEPAAGNAYLFLLLKGRQENEPEGTMPKDT